MSDMKSRMKNKSERAHKQEIVFCIWCVALVAVIPTILNTHQLILLLRRRQPFMRRIRCNLLRLQVSAMQLRIKGRNKVRSSHWWDTIVCQHFTDEDFYENFRVSKHFFAFICDRLRPALAFKDNAISENKRTVSVEKQVALSLYYLASCCEYRVVANQFGVHKTTVWRILHDFVDAVLDILSGHYIRFPNEEQAEIVAAQFEKRSHIPNIIGCINGTHIPILPPSEGYRDFINRKCWPSIVLQGVVDHQYRFRDIYINHPGSAHDTVFFKMSTVYRNHEQLIPENNVQLNGRKLHYLIIGDPAYPSLPWLLKGFTVDREEESCNSYLNSAVEIAFGRLKARWRTLLKRADVHYSFIPKLVATCCTLHNIIETMGGHFSNEWFAAVQQAEINYPQPKRRQMSQQNDLDGHQLRELFKNHLARNYPLRTTI